MKLPWQFWASFGGFMLLFGGMLAGLIVVTPRTCDLLDPVIRAEVQGISVEEAEVAIAIELGVLRGAHNVYEWDGIETGVDWGWVPWWEEARWEWWRLEYGLTPPEEEEAWDQLMANPPAEGIWLEW
jgi:hypothetical protein